MRNQFKLHSLLNEKPDDNVSRVPKHFLSDGKVNLDMFKIRVSEERDKVIVDPFGREAKKKLVDCCTPKEQDWLLKQAAIRKVRELHDKSDLSRPNTASENRRRKIARHLDKRDSKRRRL